jgi:hypothetical protein
MLNKSIRFGREVAGLVGSLCCMLERLSHLRVLELVLVAVAILMVSSPLRGQGKANTSGLEPDGPAVKAPNRLDEAAKAGLFERYGKLPLRFEVNQGQTDKQVKFVSRGAGFELFLTSNGATFGVPQSGVRRQKRDTRPSQSTTGLRESATLQMKLLGTNSESAVTGLEELPSKTNYFIGNDPRKWRMNVPTYGKVKYQGVYPGVDLIYYGNQNGQLEYDFVVAPGTDPKQIAFTIGAGTGVDSGASSARFRIDAHGDMIVGAAGTDVRFQKPIVYQKDSNGRKRYIDGKYVLSAEESTAPIISFELAPYDHSKSLIIDPVIVYCSPRSSCRPCKSL